MLEQITVYTNPMVAYVSHRYTSGSHLEIILSPHFFSKLKEIEVVRSLLGDGVRCGKIDG